MATMATRIKSADVDKLIDATVKFMRRHKWCHYAYARDSSGNRVLPDDPAACSFCATGAMEKVYGQDIFGPQGVKSGMYRAIMRRFRSKYSKSEYLDIAEYNDSINSKKELIDMLLSLKDGAE